ncbi:hypothetical protein O3G_MSEX012929 [Manduca sexta]|uniref:Ninjurin-1 n=1 Tax=Manduca sexta TaxID=7130 RepID=A0A921ZPQ9_MANSE|nr:hypothetical protein O3G_MSEX012929 [Manduca sexta]
MAREQTKLEIINESPKDMKADKILNKDIEMIFGTPNSPKSNGASVHLLNSEKNHDVPANVPRVHGKDTELSWQPLLEPDREKQKPPLAGPEIDDLDDEVHNPPGPYPGIDEGLLDIDGSKPDHPIGGEDDKYPASEDGLTHEDGAHTDDGKWLASSGDEIDYPYDGVNGLGNRFGDDRPISPMPGITPNMNTYQQKKNLAQGMMDLALLSANANQLRYVLESSTNHPYYYSSVTFISLSIILQIAVGVGLIMNSQYDVNEKDDIHKADKINNMTVLGVFLVTIVNVFITSFSVATPAVAPT